MGVQAKLGFLRALSELDFVDVALPIRTAPYTPSEGGAECDRADWLLGLVALFPFVCDALFGTSLSTHASGDKTDYHADFQDRNENGKVL